MSFFLCVHFGATVLVLFMTYVDFRNRFDFSKMDPDSFVLSGLVVALSMLTIMLFFGAFVGYWMIRSAVEGIIAEKIGIEGKKLSDDLTIKMDKRVEGIERNALGLTMPSVDDGELKRPLEDGR